MRVLLFKFSALATVLCCLLFFGPGTSQAENWTIAQITDNTGGDYYPSLYDGTIAWKDSSGIQYWNGSTTIPVFNFWWSKWETK